MKLHELKTWPEPFNATWDGVKNFEVRENDRGFEVGDLLHLRKWEPIAGIFTGKSLLVSVEYLVPGGAWGLPMGICVLGTRVLERRQ